MCYLVSLIELPEVQFITEERREYTTIENTPQLKCFFTPEETIQFLSDHEVFGWKVRWWKYQEEWKNEREMIIELYRKPGEF